MAFILLFHFYKISENKGHKGLFIIYSYNNNVDNYFYYFNLKF